MCKTITTAHIKEKNTELRTKKKQDIWTTQEHKKNKELTSEMAEDKESPLSICQSFLDKRAKIMSPRSLVDIALR